MTEHQPYLPEQATQGQAPAASPAVSPQPRIPHSVTADQMGCSLLMPVASVMGFFGQLLQRRGRWRGAASYSFNMLVAIATFALTMLLNVHWSRIPPVS